MSQNRREKAQEQVRETGALTQEALARLRAEIENVTPESREKHARELGQYLNQISSTDADGRHQALENLMRENHSVLDIQSAQSRSANDVLKLGQAFLENINADPRQGNIKFRVIFEQDIHDATIGLGHILPPNVKKVAVTDLHGNMRIGERRVSSRVGYFDENGYIPVFRNYTVEILETFENSDAEVLRQRQKEQEYFRDLLALQRQEERDLLASSVEQPRADATHSPETTRGPEILQNTQAREVLRKFSEAQIPLPEQTLIYAQRDLREYRGESMASFLDHDTLELFRITAYGGRIYNVEIKPAIHEGYEIRLRDIPRFHQFASRMRDPVFRRTVIGMLELKKRERDEDSVMFEDVRPLIEISFDEAEMTAPEVQSATSSQSPRSRTEHEIGAGFEQAKRNRFVRYVNEVLGTHFTLEDLIHEKPATPNDFHQWYVETGLSQEHESLFNRLFRAIFTQESSGDYYILGIEVKSFIRGRGRVPDRALGKYQIMAKLNWANWSREAVGRVLPPTPLNQDHVAYYHMTRIFKKYLREGNTSEMAAALTANEWYGNPRAYGTEKGNVVYQRGFPTINQYVGTILRRMNRQRG